MNSLRDRAGLRSAFVSPKMLIVLVVLGSIIGALYLGPISTYYAWEDMHGAAREKTENVVQRGLAAHLSETEGPFNPAAKNAAPSIHTLRFFVDYVAFGLPAAVEFRGTSTQGAFTGTYNTGNGEVICTADIGGHVVPGVDAAKPGHSKVKISGTYEGGKLDVKVNGKPAVVREGSINRKDRDSSGSLPGVAF